MRVIVIAAIQARILATRAGFTPQLLEQSNDDLGLPRMYRTMYVCDSFGTVGSAEALRRCHQHQATGGALVFQVTLPYEQSFFRNELTLMLRDAASRECGLWRYDGRSVQSDDLRLVITTRKIAQGLTP